MTKPLLLVVDDDYDFCDLVRFVAESHGYEVQIVTDSTTFAEVYSDKASFIVLDLAMPKVDGVELIRFLAERGYKAPLLLISGFNPGILHAAENLAKALDLNILSSHEKPVPIGMLKAALSAKNPPADPTPAPTPEAEKPFTAQEISDAIDNDEIVPFFQPRVAMRSRELIAVEALARWRHPSLGIVPPARFIPLAEETGQINKLTTKIMHAALRQCGEWKEAGLEVQVSINVSASTLTQMDYPERLEAKLQRYDLSPGNLILEVTESSVIGELATALYILSRIRMKGIHLSIDDFGTGFSSIQQLQRLPFDELKIDQSFVINLVNNSESRTIVDTTIMLGHKLRMPVVAEGIENEETWSMLRDFNCDQAQGYYIGHPMEGAEISDWRADWASRG